MKKKLFEKTLTAVNFKNGLNCFGWKSPSSTLLLEIILTQTCQSLDKITCLIIIYNHFSILAPYNIIYNTDLFCLSLIIKMESLSPNKIKNQERGGNECMCKRKQIYPKFNKCLKALHFPELLVSLLRDALESF